MNKNIEHYVFHKENFLDEKSCDNYIDKLNAGVWKKHEWYSYRTDSINFQSEDKEPEVIEGDGFRGTDIKKINDNLIQALYSAILDYIETFKFDWFVGWERYSPIRFNRYFPGQTMKNHCDHVHSLFDGERKGIPILSIIGILNDDYEGGELIMFEDKKIDTKKGDLLIFPSNFLYPHEITPVTRGVRYSYVSWVW